MTHPTHDAAPATRAPEPNLLRAIAARARRTSDGGLVACALAGTMAAGGLAWLGGRGWGVLLPMLALGAWGLWGVVDRVLDERSTRRRSDAPRGAVDVALAVARTLVAVLGVAAGVAGMLALLGMLLGKIIS